MTSRSALSRVEVERRGRRSPAARAPSHATSRCPDRFAPRATACSRWAVLPRRERLSRAATGWRVVSRRKRKPSSSPWPPVNGTLSMGCTPRSTTSAWIGRSTVTSTSSRPRQLVDHVRRHRDDGASQRVGWRDVLAARDDPTGRAPLVVRVESFRSLARCDTPSPAARCARACSDTNAATDRRTSRCRNRRASACRRRRAAGSVGRGGRVRLPSGRSRARRTSVLRCDERPRSPAHRAAPNAVPPASSGGSVGSARSNARQLRSARVSDDARRVPLGVRRRICAVRCRRAERRRGTCRCSAPTQRRIVARERTPARSARRCATGAARSRTASRAATESVKSGSAVANGAANPR